MEVLPAINRDAIRSDDCYIVAYRTESNRWRAVEGHRIPEKAERARQVLENHDNNVAGIKREYAVLNRSEVVWI